MKAVISSTYDDKYLFYLPIVTWCWNKLGVDVICFMPLSDSNNKKRQLIINTFNEQKLKAVLPPFEAPKHKEATYAQCSRLYAACLDLPEDEVLISADCDMGVFKIPPYENKFTIWGHDLVPKGQYPICYATGRVKEWRTAFNLDGLTYQQALDGPLKDDECEDYRACRWSVDQEQLFNNVHKINHSAVPRSNGENQFATNRVDRDDFHYKDRRDRFNLIDAHFWRPGFSDDNFPKILELMEFVYPEDDFGWLVKYRNSYVNLL